MNAKTLARYVQIVTYASAVIVPLGIAAFWLGYIRGFEDALKTAASILNGVV